MFFICSGQHPQESPTVWGGRGKMSQICQTVNNTNIAVMCKFHEIQIQIQISLCMKLRKCLNIFGNLFFLFLFSICFLYSWFTGYVCQQLFILTTAQIGQCPNHTICSKCNKEPLLLTRSQAESVTVCTQSTQTHSSTLAVSHFVASTKNLNRWCNYTADHWLAKKGQNHSHAMITTSVFESSPLAHNSNKNRDK